MRPCFAFAPAASDGAADTLSIYDEIGFWGVQAKDFIEALGKCKPKSLNVEINSPGGDVFAALAIYNALRASGKEIVVKVMGVAASAASLIAMAGDRIVMPKNTFLMIHNPWSFAAGNADELRETAAVLDKIGASLRATYAAKTGLDDAELDALLSKDTWLTADEALAKGFATEVVDEIKAKAKFDLGRADLPAAVRASFTAEDEEPPPLEDDAPQEPGNAPAEPPAPVLSATVADQIAQAAQAAGVSEFAALFAASCETVDAANARISAAREIAAICALSKRPEIGAAAIRAGKSVSEVRAQIVRALAEADEATNTDSKPPKELGTQTGNAKQSVSSQTIWTSHNARK